MCKHGSLKLISNSAIKQNFDSFFVQKKVVLDVVYKKEEGRD